VRGRADDPLTVRRLRADIDVRAAVRRRNSPHVDVVGLPARTV